MALREDAIKELARRELLRRKSAEGQLGQPQGGIGDVGRRDISDSDAGGMGAAGAVVEPSALDRIIGGAEAVGTMATGAIAEPVAGIAGIAQAINPLAEEGAGARAVEATREALTYQPRTEAGEEALAKVGEVVEPVAEAFKGAEDYLGREAFESTGSPALAAAAATVPTAMLEALGIASTKGFVKGAERTKEALKTAAARKAVVEAAPTIDQLKDVSRSVYKELDDSGVRLRPKPYRGLLNKVNREVRKRGFDPDITPKTAAVLNRMNSDAGKSLSLTEIDTLRKIAQNATGTVEKTDAALAASIVDNIDQFLDSVSPSAFEKGAVSASQVGPKFKVARNLWGRARRSELINDAFEKARNQASGFENGLVVQLRSILNNKKQSKFFRPQELEAMKDVVRGTTKANIAKLIGRLGFSEGHATNIIGGSLGVAGGAAVGGPVGAVAVPLVGQVSRKLAQRMTRRGAEFADTVIRAGDNAEDIAKAYMRNTPKAQRSSAELSELLMRNNINLDPLLGGKGGIAKEAAEIAAGNRAIMATQAIPGAIESTQEQQ